MDILQKIQSQSERTRKLLFWLIIIGLGVAMLLFLVKRFNQRIERFPQGELKERISPPDLNEGLEQAPPLDFFQEISDIFEEAMKKEEATSSE